MTPSGSARVRSRAGVVICLTSTLAVLLSACGGGSSDFAVTHAPTGSTVVFVALGGAEAAGSQVNDPASQGWEQLFYRKALSQKSVLYDLSSSQGTFVEDLGSGEANQALALHPGLVTVWVGQENLLSGMPAYIFRRYLTSALAKLASSKAKVLVANLLPINQFPGYRTCERDPLTCGLPTDYLPGAGELGSEIAGYDAAIAAAASATHTTVVNLNQAFTTKVADGARGGPGALVDSSDVGLTPAGEQLVASTFEAAYSNP
ncbi:MAG: hypothetical protein WAM97_04680 [Acidimicrobiales bacterium]|jgi:hypothetical protein